MALALQSDREISQFLQKDSLCLLGPCHHFRCPAKSSLCVGGRGALAGEPQTEEGESSTGQNNPPKGVDKAPGQGPERTVCCLLPRLTNRSRRSPASGSFALERARSVFMETRCHEHMSVLLGQVPGLGEERPWTWLRWKNVWPARGRSSG